MSEQDSPILSRFSLAGRVALVTGASSGLGAGFAVALAQAGADVVLAARRADKLADISRQVRELGRAALAVETDVTDPDACQAAAQAAIERFGRLDALINNAGLGTAVPALRETPEQFREVIEVNLLGAYWMAQAAARVMAPGSSIVNVASVLALMKSYNPQAAYSASKAFVRNLGEALWGELAPEGIDVLAICPGATDTEALGRHGIDPATLPNVMSPGAGAQLALDNLSRGPVLITSEHYQATFDRLLSMPRRDALAAMAARMKP